MWIYPEAHHERTVLEPNAAIKDQYAHPFELAYVITLAEHELSTNLHVKNTSLSTTPAMEFQALFHNYIRAPAYEARVSPLLGLSYYDKTEATEEARATPKKETREGVDVLKFTDSVYEDAPGRYDVLWGAGGIEVVTKNLKDVVLWNPQAEAGSKIGDMEAGGWHVFVRSIRGNKVLISSSCPGRSISVSSPVMSGDSSSWRQVKSGSASRS